MIHFSDVFNKNNILDNKALDIPLYGKFKLDIKLHENYDLHTDICSFRIYSFGYNYFRIGSGMTGLEYGS